MYTVSVCPTSTHSPAKYKELCVVFFLAKCLMKNHNGVIVAEGFLSWCSSVSVSQAMPSWSITLDSPGGDSHAVALFGPFHLLMLQWCSISHYEDFLCILLGQVYRLYVCEGKDSNERNLCVKRLRLIGVGLCVCLHVLGFIFLATQCASNTNKCWDLSISLC